MSLFLFEPRYEKPAFCICENKTQISFAVTAKLIGGFVLAIRIVQFLFYLNTKFQASGRLLSLCSPVCVRSGRKPRRPVFSERGSFILILVYYRDQSGWGGGSWDMVVSLLHRVNDCQYMYIYIVLLLYINWMNVYEEILDSTMLNV